MEEAISIIAYWIKLNKPETRAICLNGLGLKQLPLIPNTCQILYCNDNELTQLPPVLHCQELNCYNNKLTSLSELPNSCSTSISLRSAHDVRLNRTNITTRVTKLRRSKMLPQQTHVHTKIT